MYGLRDKTLMSLVWRMEKIGGQWIPEAQMITLVTIYSPCDIHNKRMLWDAVKQLRQSMEGGLWCIMGDFNSIRGPWLT